VTTFIIPLSADPSQTLTVQLGQQACRLVVRQRRTGIFVDLYLNDSPIALGMKACNLVRLVRAKYLGFIGDLFFTDTQGTADPFYTGLGTRFQFFWSDSL